MNKKVAWSTLLMLGIIVGIGFVLTQQKNRRVAQERELLNQIFFSTVDCTAPCWRGLIPGQPGLDEYYDLANVLEESGAVLRHETHEDDYIVYNWFYPESDVYLYIDIIDTIGNINRISFSNLRISNVDSLFTLLGEPNYYASRLIRDIEAIISLEFMYAEENTVIIFEGIRPNQETDDCYLDLSALQIREVYFVQSSTPSQMLEDSFSRYYPSSEAIQPWAGVEAIRIYGCVPKR